MSVRFATFNVENLFARPKVFSLPTWATGQPILDAYAEFNALAENDVYSPADKARMIELLLLLEIYRLDGGLVHRNRVRDPAWARLRANRGTFDVDHDATGIVRSAPGAGIALPGAERVQRTLRLHRIGRGHRAPPPTTHVAHR